jgi:ankyrin repeat protein
LHYLIISCYGRRQGIAANVNEGMIPVEQVEEGINVAAPSVPSSTLKTVTSAEGDTKCKEVIVSFEQQDANVAGPSSAALSLLKAVTMEGDSALHLLAGNGANGDGENVQSCARFIHVQDKDLLYEKNNRGDTPLHCAVRAGKSQLVSCLTDLAKEDGKVQDLLRMLNNNDETALHEAVRRGDKVVVEELMRADPELASFPTNGVSPLYLAIQLIDDTTILQKEDKADKSLRKEKNNDLSRKNEEKSMAQTLHDESKDGFLSYLGSNGQNALHAAGLRGPGTHEEACMRSFLAS